MSDIYLCNWLKSLVYKKQFHEAPPKQAGIAGFKNRVFFDDFTDGSTIDLTNTQTGNFNWYRSQWFNHGNTAIDAADLSVSNSVLTIASTNGRELVSAFDTDPQVPDQFHGNVFGGGGYFEARLKYDPAQVGAIGPYFYLMSIEHIADAAEWNDTDNTSLGHWPGQQPRYGHWIEVDIFETLGNNATAYQAHVHDWSGLKASKIDIRNDDSYWVAADLTNDFHVYGALWVPQNGETPGRVEFYFDNVKKQTVYFKGPVGDPPLPGQPNGNWSPSLPGQAAQTYAVIDQHRLAMNLHGSATCPLHVDWVKVWK
jgi:hypothetical protein